MIFPNPNKVVLCLNLTLSMYLHVVLQKHTLQTFILWIWLAERREKSFVTNFRQEVSTIFHVHYLNVGKHILDNPIIKSGNSQL